MKRGYDLDRIDAGYCINNSGPNNKTFCECYKMAIPYSFLGNNGVIFICREWFDYLMCYEASDYLRFDKINDRIISTILDHYPEHKNDNVSFSGYGSHRGIGKIMFRISPEPFNIVCFVSPSYFLKNIVFEGYPTYFFSTYHIRGVPYALAKKLEKKMYKIMHDNYNSIIDYVGKKNTIKKYEQLFLDLQNKIKTKIKNHESECCKNKRIPENC